MKLHSDERLLYEMRPATKLLLIWFFSKCVLRAFAGTFVYFWISMFVIALFVKDSEKRSYLSLLLSKNTLILVLFAILIVLLVYYRLLLNTHAYYITDSRCIFCGGILQRVERSIPYHKITDVEISQSIFERILGISKLRVYTPGTASVRPSFFGWGWKHGPEIDFIGLEDVEDPAAAINKAIQDYREEK